MATGLYVFLPGPLKDPRRNRRDPVYKTFPLHHNLKRGRAMKKVPVSVTVEEAVAYMVNMDYIPEGFTLLEMLDAFAEEAEVEYENARSDWTLKTRMESCISRYNLAELLLESLQHEADHPEDSMIVLAEEDSDEQRVTFDSVSYWAAYKYGIGITDSTTVDDKLKGVRWEHVTIKIWKDFKIGYSVKKGKFRRSNFRKIKLMGEKQKKPNKQGKILIDLSEQKIYPDGNYIQPNEKTAISRLRDALCMLIPLSDDPFYEHNPHEGWKPRFELIYDVDNADKRDKKKAEDTMVSIDNPENKISRILT